MQSSVQTLNGTISTPKLLPNLFVAYTNHPSGESGQFHNPIRFRFEQGDKQVTDAMRTFADYAQQAREALLNQDYGTLGELMNKNFDLRRSLYGDGAIGDDNLEMIELARSHGSPVKFCGSGGAIVGIISARKALDFLALKLQKKGERQSQP